MSAHTWLILSNIIIQKHTRYETSLQQSSVSPFLVHTIICFTRSFQPIQNGRPWEGGLWEKGKILESKCFVAVNNVEADYRNYHYLPVFEELEIWFSEPLSISNAVKSNRMFDGVAFEHPPVQLLRASEGRWPDYSIVFQEWNSFLCFVGVKFLINETQFFWFRRLDATVCNQFEASCVSF